MKIRHEGDIVNVTELQELSAANAYFFRSEFGRIFQNGVTLIEIDLSQTKSIDSFGIGALVNLYKYAQQQNRPISIRFLNPSAPVQQMFELTRMHHLFEIVLADKSVADHRHACTPVT